MSQFASYFGLRRLVAPTRSEKKRVLVLCHSSGLAGAERSMLSMLGNIDAAKFEVLVVLPRIGPLCAALDAAGISWSTARFEWWLARRNSLPIFLIRFWRTAVGFPRLVRLARSFGPDLIHTNSVVAPEGAMIAWLLGRPHCWHVRELLPDATLNSPIPRRQILSVVVGLSTQVVAVSRSVRGMFPLKSRKHIAVVSNSVGNGRFRQPTATKSAELARGRLRLVVVGTLSEKKRTVDALEALFIVRRSVPHATLLVVGSGSQDYLDRLQRFVRLRGLEDDVVFTGQIADTTDAVASCHLSIMPSWPEAFGLVTIESLAASVPVVGSRAGGTAEILEHGGGLLVPPRRPDLIAEAIVRIAGSPVMYERLVAETQTVARLFAPDREAREIQDLWSAMCR